MKREIRGYVYFGAFIIVTIALSVLMSIRKGGMSHIFGNKITKGVLDLRHIPTLDNNVIYLYGESEFYFHKFLSPDSFSDSINLEKDYIKIPGTWNEKTGQKYGYASYRFVIKVNENGIYGLKIAEFDCAYNVYINDKLYKNKSKAGTNRASTIPSWKRNEIYFPVNNHEVDIILHIANFHHRKGGPEDLMFFGKANDIIYFKTHQKSIEFFILGIIVIMIIYHIGLFILRKGEKAGLFFSLIAITFGFRLLLSGEKIFFDLFQWFPWEPAVKIEYFTFIWAIPLILYFINSLYADLFHKKIIIFITAISVLCSVFVIIFPARIYSYLPNYYQIFVLVVGFYVIVKLTKGLRQKRPFMIMIFFGLLCFYIISLAEILNYNKVILSGQVLHFGMFAFIFSQSYVLSMRYTDTYLKNEHLTKQLQAYSRSLEKKVENRTSQIKTQAEILELNLNELQEKNKKLEELDKFKNGLTSMIVHDLKNPLNIILSLSRTNTENYNIKKIRNSGKQMLNLIMNMLDVEKYENSKIVLKKTEFKIYKLVDEVYQQTEELFEEKNILFKAYYPEELSVKADYSLIERILINLITNAIKYSPCEGEVVLDINSDKNGDCIFQVQDTGLGIPQEAIPHIFSKFGQIKAQDSGKIQSTGLGLAFCKLAVEGHSGFINITNTPKGAMFYFTLPNSRIFTKEKIVSLQRKPKKETDVYLSEEEKSYLLPICLKLKQVDIYEISKIKNIVSLIQSDKKGIIKWKQKFDHATKTINEKDYKSLIDEIINW